MRNVSGPVRKHLEASEPVCLFPTNVRPMMNSVSRPKGDPVEEKIRKPVAWTIPLFVALVLVGLYLSSLYSYLLFHSLVELFSIAIAAGIFMIAWNARRFLDNNYLLFLGVAYFFIGGMDLAHTLAYQGMGVFRYHGANLATQLWVATRYTNGLSLLIAPLFLDRRMNERWVFVVYGTFTTLLMVSIFHWNIFPDCFVEGSGLTPFKKISEYVISAVLLVSIVLLYRRRQDFDSHVLTLLVWSIVLTIGAELAFTRYASVYGLFNLIGHMLKFVSYYLIYRAIIQTGLVKPYNLLFRNLKQSEENLHRANQALEERVEARTRELEKKNEELQMEILGREKVEESLRESEKRLRFLSSQLITAQENERKRIVRELHDGLGQVLTAIKFKLGHAVRKTKEDGRKVDAESMESLLPMIQQGIDEARRIGMDLRPSMLDDLGVLATIGWFCREFQRVYSNITLRKELEFKEHDVPDLLKTVLYRVLQEALNNIAKHSQADLVSIRLTKIGDRMELLIEDNGRGFDPKEVLARDSSSRGFGLSSMRERTELSGGWFQLESSEGRGTAIRASWSLSQP